jgi:5-carboxymethyl-2-hydroxymuconate isomerase
VPHCIVEYSPQIAEKLPIEQIMHAVYKGANQSELFEPEDIKVRAQAFEHFYSMARKKSFVHVNLKILSGRDLTKRKKLSESVIKQLERLGIELASITVEVTNIERESYAKILTF